MSQELEEPGASRPMVRGADAAVWSLLCAGAALAILVFELPVLARRAPTAEPFMWTVLGGGALWVVGMGLGIAGAIRANRRAWRWVAFAGIFIGLTTVVVAPIVWRSLWPREGVGRQRCPSNLRLIGQAVLLYSLEHDGWNPDRLERLIVHVDLAPIGFVCPYSDDEIAPGKTREEQAANLSKTIRGRKHLSYVYRGAGLKFIEMPPHFVLAYEPLENHDRAGMHVLLGDGSVRFVNITEAERILAELDAGHNPPRPEMLRGP
jgi:hypothetical protein